MSHISRIGYAGALAAGTALSRPGIIRARTRDNGAMLTFDRATVDSTGAFLVGELERLDQTLNMPLVDYTWSRDIDVRTDVTIADEAASFTNSTFAAVGGTTPNGKAWIGKDSSVIASLALDIGKTSQPLYLWGMQVGWTIPELESAQKIGRPIDTDKYEGMQLKWQMDTDEQVYIGDATLGLTGLVNHASVTNLANVANGADASPLWASKTPDEILRDVNEICDSAWAASGWSTVPNRLLLPTTSFSYIVSQKVSAQADKSILTYLKDNSLSLAKNGQALEILPVKWLNGRGAGGTNRMVAYTKAPRFVRYPMVPLARTPMEYRDLRQLTTYYGRLGAVEVRYGTTVAYRDGI
jgi:hypothetical protein